MSVMTMLVCFKGLGRTRSSGVTAIGPSVERNYFGEYKLINVQVCVGPQEIMPPNMHAAKYCGE